MHFKAGGNVFAEAECISRQEANVFAEAESISRQEANVFAEAESISGQDAYSTCTLMIVPTLRVVTPLWTLRVRVMLTRSVEQGVIAQSMATINQTCAEPPLILPQA
jgi:hypothetical protein